MMKLKEVFVQQAKRILVEHPDLPHEWNKTGGDATLFFPKQDSNGFDITIEAGSKEILVITEGGAHEHFGVESSEGATIQEALGLVRDLLSLGMRLRVLYAGKYPYKWILEKFNGITWCEDSTSGLIFYNYFGKKSERIFQNYILPSRVNAG